MGTGQAEHIVSIKLKAVNCSGYRPRLNVLTSMLKSCPAAMHVTHKVDREAHAGPTQPNRLGHKPIRFVPESLQG